MGKAIDKYANYTIRVGEDDLNQRVSYREAAAGGLLRVHYRVSRVPSRQEFVLRHCVDATAADRAQAVDRLDRLPSAFANWEKADVVWRRKARIGGYWFFYAFAGTPVDDPLVQLELEMLIDSFAGPQVGAA